MGRQHRKNQFYYAPVRKPSKGHPIFWGFLLTLTVCLFSLLIVNTIIVNQLQYDKQTITVTSLPEDLESWSILHISDLHGRQMGKQQNIIRNALGSNVRVSSVVFTGDMVGADGDLTPFLDLLALLPAETPKLYVPGDEDPAYLDPTPHANVSPLSDWAQALTEAGVTILDEPILFTRGRKDNARIWFVPANLYELDINNLEAAYSVQLESLTGQLTPEQAAQKRVAEYQVSRAQRIRTAIASMQATDIQIAVTHTPLTSTYLSEMTLRGRQQPVFSLANVSLILSGHYCAGQVRIPGKGALYVPEYGWFPDDHLLMGLGYLGNIPQYISPGLGSSGAYPFLPWRLFNPPSIAYIKLTANLT